MQVILSGNKTLTEYLGEKKFVGDIKHGEKRRLNLKLFCLRRIPSEAATLKIELKRG